MIDYGVQALLIVCLLYGSWASGSLQTRAIAVKMVGSVAGIITASVHFVPGFIILNVVLLCMQIRNIINWRRRGVPW